MKKIEVNTDWCDVDMLDGKPITNGENLKIRWTNGEVTTETILVKDSSYTVVEHGGRADISVRKAFVVVDFKGAKAMVALAGQDILAEIV